tara:strand:+ start:380 stop:745 length:366 start_codon:yes stop_codon:yes gene_type:complete
MATINFSDDSTLVHAKKESEPDSGSSSKGNSVQYKSGSSSRGFPKRSSKEKKSKTGKGKAAEMHRESVDERVAQEKKKGNKSSEFSRKRASTEPEIERANTGHPNDGADKATGKVDERNRK